MGEHVMNSEQPKSTGAPREEYAYERELRETGRANIDLMIQACEKAAPNLATGLRQIRAELAELRARCDLGPNPLKRPRFVGVRQLPEQELRVETGAIRFGDDRAGVFFRGDAALAVALGLRQALRRLEGVDPFTQVALESALRLFSSCDERMMVSVDANSEAATAAADKPETAESAESAIAAGKGKGSA